MASGNSVFPNKNDFSAGEISERLRLRHETELYRRGVRHATNMVPDPMGSISRRGGTKFLRSFESVGAKFGLEFDYVENIVPRRGYTERMPDGFVQSESSYGTLVYDNRSQTVLILSDDDDRARVVGRFSELRGHKFVGIFPYHSGEPGSPIDGIGLMSDKGRMIVITNSVADKFGAPEARLQIASMTVTKSSDTESAVSLDIAIEPGAGPATVEYQIMAGTTPYPVHKSENAEGTITVSHDLDVRGSGRGISARARLLNDWSASDWVTDTVAYDSNPVSGKPVLSEGMNEFGAVRIDWEPVTGADVYYWRYGDVVSSMTDWSPWHKVSATSVMITPSADRQATMQVEVAAASTIEAPPGADFDYTGRVGSITVNRPDQDTATDITTSLQIATDFRVTVAWAIPEANDLLSVMGFRIRWRKKTAGDTEAWSPWCYLSAGETDYSFIAGEEDEDYEAQVGVRYVETAWKDVLTSAITATPGSIPSEPTITLSPGNTVMDIAWTEIYNGGQDITSLTLEWKLSADPTWTQVTLDITDRSHQLTGLTNDTEIDVRLVIVNAIGTRTTSATAATPSTTPQPPSTDGISTYNVSADERTDGSYERRGFWLPDRVISSGVGMGSVERTSDDGISVEGFYVEKLTTTTTTPRRTVCRWGAPRSQGFNSRSERDDYYTRLVNDDDYRNVRRWEPPYEGWSYDYYVTSEHYSCSLTGGGTDTTVAHKLFLLLPDDTGNENETFVTLRYTAGDNSGAYRRSNAEFRDRTLQIGQRRESYTEWAWDISASVYAHIMDGETVGVSIE